MNIDQNNNNGVNWRFEYGKLIEKVDTIQKTLDEQKVDIKFLSNNLNKLENRETNGCNYSHNIEKRVRIIEDWKNNLSGKIYIFLTFAIIIVQVIMDKIIKIF